MIYSNNSIRSYLLFLLIASFLIASLALFLLLVQGKKITREGQIVETGLVRVQTIPNNVDIYVNGKKADKSGSLIQNIPLGEITLVAQKQGYTPWENTVEVKSGQVSEIFIQLFPENLSIEQLVPFEIDEIEYSRDLSSIYFTVIEGNADTVAGIWRLPLSSGLLNFGRTTNPELVYQFSNNEIAVLQNTNYEMSLSPNASKMLFKHDSGAQYVISFNGDSEKINLVDYLGFEAEEAAWLSNDTLMIKNDNLLLDINVSRIQHRFVSFTGDNPLVYCKNGDTVYWANQESNLVFKYQSGESEPVVIENTNFFNIQNLYCASDNGSIFVVQDNNGLRYIDTNLELNHSISAGLAIDEISPNGRTMILTDGNSQFIYKTKIGRNNESIEGTLYRIESTGVNPFFSLSDNRVVYISETLNGFSSVLVSDTDGANRVPILSEVVIEEGGIAISPDNKNIYLLMQVQNPEAAGSDPIKSLYKINLD